LLESWHRRHLIQADRKRPRDDRADDDAGEGGSDAGPGGMAGLPGSAAATPARNLTRLRQGGAPQNEAASSIGGSDDDGEFNREDEEELRRNDDVLDEADNMDEEDGEGEDLFGDSLER